MTMSQAIKRFLRRFPLLYTAVYRVRFVLSPARLLARLIAQPACQCRARKSTVIAGPQYLGFAGGIYNPGALPTKDGGVILLAKGEVCHWWDAVGVKADLYNKGSPVIFTLDQDLSVRSSRVVRLLENYPPIDKVSYSDFRVFQYNGEIWVNHSMIPLVRRHACVWTFSEAKPCLSRLDSTYTRLTFLGYPQIDFPANKMEKNWLYVEQDGNLYLFYSFHPYRVLKLIDRKSLTFATVINQPLEDRLADIGGYKTMMSFSTNPIEYDNLHWLLLVHQIEPGLAESCYHHWGVLIDKETMLPRKITAKPLFSGMGARGRKPGILYVSAVVKRGTDFVFFCGEGDAYTTRMSVHSDVLEQSWSDLYPTAKQKPPG